MPSSLFFLNSSSPPAAIHLHRSTSGPPRFHPFPESEVRAKLQTSSTSLHLHIRLLFSEAEKTAGPGRLLSLSHTFSFETINLSDFS
ncbi:hypothetical protein E1A91_D08G064200v1 [Gossypium mustelinum]|uniref:Uncharacterized protein n=1 Tax=Gossypium mustelinum TaxID=34275 RepID=A0A5D2TS87_GOSMU|nr:hypothetical protein E1A91_D08G064200v1 [Gossypium mustelinum]